MKMRLYELQFPSMLLSARNGDGEVVGCVAIEVSVCKEEVKHTETPM